jgi:hypothetical protein
VTVVHGFSSMSAWGGVRASGVGRSAMLEAMMSECLAVVMMSMTAPDRRDVNTPAHVDKQANGTKTGPCEHLAQGTEHG